MFDLNPSLKSTWMVPRLGLEWVKNKTKKGMRWQRVAFH